MTWARGSINTFLSTERGGWADRDRARAAAAEVAWGREPTFTGEGPGLPFQ